MYTMLSFLFESHLKSKVLFGGFNQGQLDLVGLGFTVDKHFEELCGIVLKSAHIVYL